MFFPLPNTQYNSCLFQIRQMAAVLLRRIVANTVDFIKKLGDEAMVAVKADLLRGIQEEQNPSVRRKICDATSELAKSLLGTKLKDPSQKRCTPTLLHVQVYTGCVMILGANP